MRIRMISCVGPATTTTLGGKHGAQDSVRCGTTTKTDQTAKTNQSTTRSPGWQPDLPPARSATSPVRHPPNTHPHSGSDVRGCHLHHHGSRNKETGHVWPCRRLSALVIRHPPTGNRGPGSGAREAYTVGAQAAERRSQSRGRENLKGLLGPVNRPFPAGSRARCGVTSASFQTKVGLHPASRYAAAA